MISIWETIQNLFLPHRIIEDLNEMATVCWDDRQNLLIQVNPDSGRRGLEYFKLYDASNHRKADRIARIEFRQPKYVIHKNSDGKKNWFLNAKEKQMLINLLSSPYRKSGDLTNWQHAIVAFNTEKGLHPDQTEENLLSGGELKYPNHLPFDLPMPDYTKLQK